MTQNAHDPERTRPTAVDGPTVAIPADGPTVAGWTLDDLMREPPSGPLVWQDARHPAIATAPLATRSVGYHVSLAIAVLLVIGIVTGLVMLALNRPVRVVTGSATGVVIPTFASPKDSTPPSATGDQPAGPATHPLSTSTATMADVTCALTRFDPSDAGQERFFRQAKACADDGFRDLLAAAGLPAVDVPVVTVHGGPARTPCGTVEATDPATQCRGTVYMTPARLRDVEGLGRYPGRYLGVFLREYAEAVQFATGLTELAQTGDDRLAQQATCLAGIASAAMAGRGAVDANITNEIRARLSSVDAPADADAWLAKGFQSRQPASCDTWN
jgi:hypothetical protein